MQSRPLERATTPPFTLLKQFKWWARQLDRVGNDLIETGDVIWKASSMYVQYNFRPSPRPPGMHTSMHTCTHQQQSPTKHRYPSLHKSRARGTTTSRSQSKWRHRLKRYLARTANFASRFTSVTYSPVEWMKTLALMTRYEINWIFWVGVEITWLNLFPRVCFINR